MHIIYGRNIIIIIQVKYETKFVINIIVIVRLLRMENDGSNRVGKSKLITDAK